MGFDLSLPFVLIIFSSGFCSRLTPVLVNGMKYSEIDIILLKVSLYSLIFVPLGKTTNCPMTQDDTWFN